MNGQYFRQWIWNPLRAVEEGLHSHQLKYNRDDTMYTWADGFSWFCQVANTSYGNDALAFRLVDSHDIIHLAGYKHPTRLCLFKGTMDLAGLKPVSLDGLIDLKDEV